MAVSFVDSTSNSAGSGTAVSVSKPTGLSIGDVVIVVVHANGPQNVSDNNGATAFTSALANREYNGPSAQVDVFYRVITGAEGSTFNFTLDGSNRWTIVAAGYSGVNTSSVFDVAPSVSTENTGSGATQTTNSVVTSLAGGYAITFAVNDSNSLSFSATPGDSFTIRENLSGTQLLGYADKSITSATTQAAVSWEQSTSNGTWLNHMFALLPASAADEEVDVSDNITVSEGVGLSFGSEISVSDATTLSESVSAEIAFAVGVGDTATVSESVSAFIPALTLSVSDDVTLSESLSLLFDCYLVVGDTATLSESVSLDIEVPASYLEVSVSDTATLSEGIGTSLANTILVVDFVEVTENNEMWTDRYHVYTADEISVSDETRFTEGIIRYKNSLGEVVQNKVKFIPKGPKPRISVSKGGSRK